MTISIELIKILIIFFPGIWITSILQFFNLKNKEYSNLRFLLYSFINGVLILFILGLLGLKDFLDPNTKDVFAVLYNLPISLILYIFLLSTTIGITFLYIKCNSFTHWIAYSLGFTYETGSETLLDAIYHSKAGYLKELQDSAVHIKLLNGEADYYGFLRYYEIQNNLVEIILSSPQIRFNKNFYGKEYTQDNIYLQLQPFSFQIEYVTLLEETKSKDESKAKEETEEESKKTLKEKLTNFLENKGDRVGRKLLIFLWFLVFYFRDSVYIANTGTQNSLFIHYFISF